MCTTLSGRADHFHLIIDCGTKIKSQCRRSIVFESRHIPGLSVFNLPKTQRFAPSALKTNTQRAPQTGLQGMEASLLEQVQGELDHSSNHPLLCIHLPLCSTDPLGPSQMLLYREPAHLPRCFPAISGILRLFFFIKQPQPERLNGHISVSSSSTSPTPLIQVNL